MRRIILWAFAVLLPVVPATGLSADLNRDGVVDFDDFFLFGDQFGRTGDADVADTVVVIRTDTVQVVIHDTLVITLTDTVYLDPADTAASSGVLIGIADPALEYLDEYYDLYVIRHGDHERLVEFAKHSRRPVINAMSSQEHPCEAIADAHWFTTTARSLDDARVVLWGPTTNVLRSWRNVAKSLGADVITISEATELPDSVDLVVTDGWPALAPGEAAVGLEVGHLEKMGNPILLPTPPFTIGEELRFDPLTYEGFAGYAQKNSLRTVQEAIIRRALAPEDSGTLRASDR